MLELGVQGQGQLATATEGLTHSCLLPLRALLSPSLHAQGHKCAHMQKTGPIRRDAAETRAHGKQRVTV